MMPIDTRVIRYRPDTDDRAAATTLLEALIAAETAGDHVLGTGDQVKPVALTPILNKLLQNALSILVRNRPVSVIVLDDQELLDVSTAAEILGFGAIWINKMILKGHIAPHQHKAGRKHLIPGHAVVDRVAADPKGHANRMAARRAQPDRPRGRRSAQPPRSGT